MYDSVFPQQATEVLSRLFALIRRAPRDVATRLNRESAGLSPDLLTNLRQFGSTPTPRQLQALKLRLSLTIGGAFKLFGYKLDSMRSIEALLNGGRTRFVESYPFHRDRPVDLPGTLAHDRAFQDTAFLSDLVVRWQKQIPIRAIRGPHWQKNGFLYAQLGSSDTLAMPRIPPGSHIALRPIGEQERQNPNPMRMYFLQHGSGYLCCGCTVRQRRLLLITEDHDYAGPHEFFYPGEIRIVGRVTSFGVRLPFAVPSLALPQRTHRTAPLILPWEHRSLPELISAERQRFGITEAHLARASEILESHLGASVSARTLRRYEQEKERAPRTAVLICLALIHSLRLTDVLRILNLWTDESQHYSLNALMSATTFDDLPTGFPPAEAPDPVTRWQPLLDEWGEWPTLLSMAMPNLGEWGHQILRINQSAWFKGLDPLLAPHSVVVLNELNVSPPLHTESQTQNWDRQLFALRHEDKLFCGYLEAHGANLVLLPHPRASGTPRVTFRRNQVQILGQIAAVASPL
jgi:transcriptional regulator with XRE-family HTH domain